MHSIQQTSAETLKLETLLSNASKGNYFSYKDLQKLTGVLMDNRGKTFMRSALRRLKMPYEVVKGEGIKLLCSDNASRIVVTKVIKIDNSVKRADKTTKQVRDKVYNELTETEQKNINFLSALFGTIRSYSQSAKKIFYSEPLKIGTHV